MSDDQNQTAPEIADAFPLTPLQQGMLFHILSRPKEDQYLGTITADIYGPVTQAAAQIAWQTLIERHEALRTAFLWETLEEPVQVVHAKIDFSIDWHMTQAKHANPPSVDISRAPLMHVAMVQQGPQHIRLFWHIHHLIADGWSAGIVLQELLYLLNADEIPPAPAFAEHADWLDSLTPEDEVPFWEAYFRGHTHKSLPQTGTGHGFDSISFNLAPNATKQATAEARAQKVTLGTVIQNAFAEALGRMTGQTDVLFGLASSGRSSPVQDVEKCVGLFVNTLPVRVDLSQPDRLHLLEETSLALRAREHVPQSLLARISGTPAGANMVEAVLSIRSLPDIQPVGAFRVSAFTARTPSNFPLTLEVDPATGVVQALFDRAVLTRKAVIEFVEGFERALTEQNALQEKQTELVGPALTGQPQDVLNRFLQVASRMPTNLAVSDPDSSLSYQALLKRANAIAAHLVDNQVLPGDRVALVLPRSVDFIAAMLGTLIAGAAYVPVDATYPEERIATILEDSSPKVVLRQAQLRDIQDGASASCVTASSDSAAYVIYTSGSTGRPKGVEISRGALANSQSARDAFYPNAPKAFLLLSPFAFDSSVVGIYWALTAGAHLVIAPTGAEQNSEALGDMIAQHQVTHTLMLPTLYSVLLETIETAQLASLRQVIVAGEVCPHDLPMRHVEHLPLCGLANEYGPTEATVWATCDLNAPGTAENLTIGKPIPGMQVMLLNDDQVPVAPGDAGEVALAGPALATGYVNNPRQTSIAFPHIRMANGSNQRVYLTGDRARLRPDGRLQYLGRSDRQVKIRGYRIEMDEVEAALTALGGIRDVAVRAVPARPASEALLQETLDRLAPAEAAALIQQAGGAD